MAKRGVLGLGAPQVLIHGAVGDLAQVIHHGAEKAPGEPEADGHLEATPPAGEVLVEPTSDGIEAVRGTQDPRADLGSQTGEDRVVVLAIEGDPNQALGHGRHEKAAHGAADGPVGDVEQVAPLGLDRQAGGEPVAGLCRFMNT
jgi:hypothetical protein